MSQQPADWYYAVEQDDGTHIHVGVANPSPQAADYYRRVAIRQAARRGGRPVKVEHLGRYETGEMVWGRPVIAYRHTMITPIAGQPESSKEHR